MILLTRGTNYKSKPYSKSKQYNHGDEKFAREAEQQTDLSKKEVVRGCEDMIYPEVQKAKRTIETKGACGA